MCYPLIRVLSPHPYPAIRIRVLSQPPLDHAPKIHVTPIATVRFQGINAYFQRCSNAFKMQAQAQLQMAVHIEMVERVSSFPKYYVCITGSPISGCTCCHHNMYNIIYYYTYYDDSMCSRLLGCCGMYTSCMHCVYVSPKARLIFAYIFILKQLLKHFHGNTVIFY